MRLIHLIAWLFICWAGITQSVLGATSHVLAGVASWYSEGGTTASGARLDPSAHTCAMLAVPMGRTVKIYNTSNHKWSWCKVNDHGPYITGRIIDVTPKVRDELGIDGIAKVKVYY